MNTAVKLKPPGHHWGIVFLFAIAGAAIGIATTVLIFGH